MLCRWQHERGNSHAVKALFERAYAICWKHPNEDLDDLLSDLHDGPGAAATETNDPQACLHHGKAPLSIRQRVAHETGKKDIRLAIAYNEIGIGWIMAKEYVYEHLPDNTGYTRALPLVNIGLANWLLGDLDQASSALEQGLEERKTMFGLDDKESFRYSIYSLPPAATEESNLADCGQGPGVSYMH